MPSGVFALMLLTLSASRAFLVAMSQLDCRVLALQLSYAFAAFIVASLQLTCAELSMCNSHSCFISALPAYGFSRFKCPSGI